MGLNSYIINTFLSPFALDFSSTLHTITFRIAQLIDRKIMTGQPSICVMLWKINKWPSAWYWVNEANLIKDRKRRGPKGSSQRYSVTSLKVKGHKVLTEQSVRRLAYTPQTKAVTPKTMTADAVCSDTSKHSH